MNKPLIFAVRGAVGFGLTGVIFLGGLAAFATVRLSIITQIGLAFLPGAVGAAVFRHGNAHWARTALGFGVAFVLAFCLFLISIIIAFAINGPSSESGPYTGLYTAVIFGCCYAMFGGIGGCSLRSGLALPGTIAFGLPGALAGFFSVTAPSSTLALFALSLTIGGALFGLAAGWSEERACPTLPPPD